MRSLYRVVRTPGEARRVQGVYEYPKLESDKKPDGKKETEESKQLSEIGESLIQAEKILDTARLEAEKIKEGAYEEGYAQGKEDGYRSGYEAGKEEGIREGKKHYVRTAQELEIQMKACMEELQVEKEKLLETYMDDLKNIALAIGEKIVRISLRSDARVVERMIVAATDKLKKSAWAKIYVGSMGGSGTDIKSDPRFLKELSNLSENVKIIFMDETEPGTCIVERPDEIIDISVGSQLENIREIMNNARL